MGRAPVREAIRTEGGRLRELTIQSAIEAAIGAEPDLVLMRNAVGSARHVNERTGRVSFTRYGLLPGSPDLVAILAPVGRWFCLELKVPGEQPTAEQTKCHAVWRRFGAFVAVATSVEEARAALSRARRGATE